jgi:DNA (cytosine-5)-methyltransferase 1
MATRKPLAVELFCGVGGMSLGFEQTGFNVAVAIDSNEINVEYHKINFPNCRTLLGDLSTMTGAEIREKGGLRNQHISVVLGGPPCQGFSFIGKRDAKDERNKLINHFIRLVGELEPDYFVMENVEGLTVGPAKKLLKSFVQRANSRGYEVVSPIRVLDAADYGVPQRRRRVFVLGHKEGVAMPNYPETRRGWCPTVLDAIGDLPDLHEVEQLFHSDICTAQLGEPSTYARALRHSKPNGKQIRGSAVLSGCLLTRHSPKTARRFAATKPGDKEPISRFHRLDPKGVACASDSSEPPQMYYGA